MTKVVFLVLGLGSPTCVLTSFGWVENDKSENSSLLLLVNHHDSHYYLDVVKNLVANHFSRSAH